MSNLKCPVCHTSDVVETDRTYQCANKHYPALPGDCTFTLWKDGLKKLGKPKITVAELAKLVAGTQIPLKLKSTKDGKPYDCLGELQLSGQYYSVKLIFADRAAGKPVAIPSKSVSESDSTGEAESYEEEVLEDC